MICWCGGRDSRLGGEESGLSAGIAGEGREVGEIRERCGGNDEEEEGRVFIFSDSDGQGSVEIPSES